MSDEQFVMLMRTDHEPDDAQWERADALVTQLFREHAHLLKRKLSRQCRQDKLDDLVQESFLALRRALARPTDDPIRDPIGLLYTIASHVFADQLRREVGSRRFSQSLDALASQVPDPAIGPEEWMCRIESLRLRQEIVKQLPAEQRRIVKLRVSGLKPSEIGKEMNISIRRVYRLSRLAFERCKRRWQKSGIDNDPNID